MEYMSQEGYDELVAELQHMVNVELPAVRDAIAEARDKGDLSENFEYHAAKREQGQAVEPHQLQTEGLGECPCHRQVSPEKRYRWLVEQD